MFDLSQRPRVLYLGEIDHFTSAQAATTSIPVEEMLTVLPRLIGMIPPPADSSLVTCQPGPAGLVWLDVPSAGTRTLLTEGSWQPRRIEIAGRDGGTGLLLNSPSSRLVRVEIPGTSTLNWPQVAAVMDAKAVSEATGRAKFAFDRMSTDMEGEPLERVFDVATLQQALRPEVVRPLIDPELRHDLPDP